MGSCQLKLYNDSSHPSKYHLNWMKNIPDSTDLSAMTIPGTHDTASLYGICCARTQTWNFSEQLKAGLRYFDLRLRMYNDTLKAFHGFVDQKFTFDKFLIDANDFLENNPSETIIFQVICEYKIKNCKKNIHQLYEEYTKNYINKIVDYKYKKISLGEIRGKILMIKIFHGSTRKISNFKIQNKWTCNFRTHINNKKREIKKHFQRSLYGNDGHTIYLNFLSASSDYAMMTPYTAATFCNKIPLKYKGKLGIVLIDYPGEDLIDHLISQNFIEKKEKDLIKNGHIIYIIHNDIGKYLHIIKNKENNNEYFCRKEPMIWTITHKNNKIDRNTFKVGDNILLSNGEIICEFLIGKTYLEEDKNKEIREGTLFALQIMKDNIWKYMSSDYSKKTKDKKYLFEYLDNIKDEFSCYFTIENTNYKNMNNNDPTYLTERNNIKDV